MKKVTTTILMLIAALTVIAQEKWDQKTCSYTNHQWHFHWNLDKELDWEYNQGNERHTVFKAISPYGLMAYVNINPNAASEQENWDFWDHFEDYKNVLKMSWDKVTERTGGKIIPIKIEKCKFFGEHAIKVIVKTEMMDDVHNETSYSTTYTFHKDGATWNATIMASPDIWNFAGEDGIKELFINFGPNAK